MLRTWIIRTVVIALGVCWRPELAAPTTLVLTESVALAKTADKVVLGKVAKVESEWLHGRIVSRVSLRVEETLKGKGEATLELVVPGGSVGGIAMLVIGGPRFREGDRAILFLRQADTEYRILGLAQGKVSVLKNDSGVESVRWVPPGGTQVVEEPLSEVIAQLRLVSDLRGDDR